MSCGENEEIHFGHGEREISRWRGSVGNSCYNLRARERGPGQHHLVDGRSSRGSEMEEKKRGPRPDYQYLRGRQKKRSVGRGLRSNSHGQKEKKKKQEELSRKSMKEKVSRREQFYQIIYPRESSALKMVPQICHQKIVLFIYYYVKKKSSP